MLKFIVLFFAAFAVFSPLFLIGIRKYTGRRAKRALGAHIASFFAFLVLASVVGIGGSASAAGAPEAAAAAGGIAEGLKYVGAALAVGLSGIGGDIFFIQNFHDPFAVPSLEHLYRQPFALAHRRSAPDQLVDGQSEIEQLALQSVETFPFLV